MAPDSIEERFGKRQDKKKLHDLSQRGRSTEDVEAEEDAIEQARKQREADPDKYKLTKADTIGRNDPCPCGSGKKYKKCCGAKK